MTRKAHQAMKLRALGRSSSRSSSPALGLSRLDASAGKEEELQQLLLLLLPSPDLQRLGCRQAVAVWGSWWQRSQPTSVMHLSLQMQKCGLRRPRSSNSLQRS